MSLDNPLIVGIGASAGGIPAMEALFRALGAEDRLSFVIVTHLNPDRESRLGEVIATYTELPVETAADGARIEAGRIYVMPENATLTVSGGRLRLHRGRSAESGRRPIDVFLASLAEDQGADAVGIILSGGDSDGTLGLKAIKQHAGITFAQVRDGGGPRNPEMPESAIDSGLVDFALPASEMPAKLREVLEHRPMLAEMTERAERDDAGLQDAHEQIAQLLRSHTGHDFSGYKSKTFMRRLARRMQLQRDADVEAYIERLRRDPQEIATLFRDLLINVTEFFRDADAFRMLETEVVPKLFEGRGADESVRIWVPGCATGEEVYSLGILMREHMDRLDKCPRVQIFATDIDEPSLAVARAGRYPQALLKGVSEARQARYFRREAGTLVVSKELRNLCIFSPHSVISDPPFSRMDMVSCRNLLIYLGRDLQDQVIPTFHYALKPGGYLFLGSSENISQHSDLFAAVDRKLRIFQARGHGSQRPRLPATFDGIGAGLRRASEDEPAAGSSVHQLRQRVEVQVLERHAPAHVVIRNEGDIIYFSGHTGRFLEMPRGAPNRHLLEVARRDLRLDLRSTLRDAMESGHRTVRRTRLKDETTGKESAVDITVETLDGHDATEKLFLVLFAPVPEVNGMSGDDGGGDDEGAAARAERELDEMRERMQSTVEEYETALEELKSSNEELVSVNEEAQSTNEELEASKEEMQSLNEELTTINAELNAKVEELDRANGDLRNLYDATRIATVFLDGDLVVRNFTPAASSFFHLRPTDLGRPLTDLASEIDYPELQGNIRKVFETGELLEHRLSPNGQGGHYLVRLVPYRDATHRITGVLVTLVDVTTIAEAEAHQRVLIEELNHRVKNMLAVVISIAKATLRNQPSPAAFTDAFVGRLQGMARAYELLSRENWAQVCLADLLRQELDPWDIARFDLDGPPVCLRPEQSLALGLAVHELATNAAKYGALSRGEGKVGVEWSTGDGGMSFRWQEKDGPPVVDPEHKGFGFVLIQGQIETQLGGAVTTTFDPHGLIVEMSLPMAPGQEAD